MFSSAVWVRLAVSLSAEALIACPDYPDAAPLRQRGSKPEQSVPGSGDGGVRQIRVDGSSRAQQYETVQAVENGPIQRDMAFSSDSHYLYVMSETQPYTHGSVQPNRLLDQSSLHKHMCCTCQIPSGGKENAIKGARAGR
ncbi:Plexin-A4 [Liparis tanakae]|uniref:Plexin-A4 n=1 Tax=Liparis tanakae TaxID=230148 RepID=A0A4Z2GA12_9TELE|nr:Plexin-A4 [Liparis tanakae]